MNEFILYIKNFKEVYGLLVVLTGLIIGSYNGYLNIQQSISNNNKSIETTQITMLKSITRAFEGNHNCKISNQEWDEYLLNYSVLFDLKIKHNMLSNKAKWLPIERSKKDCL